MVDDHLALLALAVAGHVLVLDLDPPVHVNQDHVLVALVQSLLVLGFLDCTPILELDWLHFGQNVRCEVVVIKDDLPFILVSFAVLAVVVVLEYVGTAVDQWLHVLKPIFHNLLQVH